MKAVKLKALSQAKSPEDYHLKVVIVILPASKPSIWLLSPQGILFLQVAQSFCQYGCLLDLDNGCPMEHQHIAEKFLHKSC